MAAGPSRLPHHRAFRPPPRGGADAAPPRRAAPHLGAGAHGAHGAARLAGAGEGAAAGDGTSQERGRGDGWVRERAGRL